jgi:hypothetical protein
VIGAVLAALASKGVLVALKWRNADEDADVGETVDSFRFYLRREVYRCVGPQQWIRTTNPELCSDEGFRRLDVRRRSGKEGFLIVADLSQTFAAFENLGDNCEFGIAQRQAGIEPLGLFRFAGTKHLPSLIAAISTRFADFGDPDDVEIFGEDGQFYGIHIKSYHVIYATPFLWGSKDPHVILRQEIARIGILKRRLIEDMVESKKTFVRKGQFDSLEDIQALGDALRKHGPNNLLWVREEDTAYPNGTVETVSDNIVSGRISKFAPYSDVPSLVLSDWATVCEKCNELLKEPKYKTYRSVSFAVAIRPHAATEQSAWDPYAHWLYSRSASATDWIDSFQRIGVPNIASDRLVSVVAKSVEIAQAESGKPSVTVIDFGCGLGRNSPLLRRLFHRVVGFDRPEMISLLRSEQSSDMISRYDAVYDDLETLLSREQICILYDSVAMQRITTVAEVAEFADRLATLPTLVAIVSLSSLRKSPAVVDTLLREHNWTTVLSEIDWSSFSGYPHNVRVVRRPTKWKLEVRDKAIGMTPDDGPWRPITIGDTSTDIAGSWTPVAIHSSLAPVLLVTVERGGAIATWFVDETGYLLGDSVEALPDSMRDNIRQTLRGMMATWLRRKFTGTSDKALELLLSLLGADHTRTMAGQSDGAEETAANDIASARGPS